VRVGRSRMVERKATTTSSRGRDRSIRRTIIPPQYPRYVNYVRTA
jgi:hypothetical protein